MHIDSDLYSSALYCLFVLGAWIGRFHVMFDEAGGGEARALRDYLVAHGGAFTPCLGLKKAAYSTMPLSLFGFLDARTS